MTVESTVIDLWMKSYRNADGKLGYEIWSGDFALVIQGESEVVAWQSAAQLLFTENKQLIEALDAVTTSLETVMAHYGPDMSASDQQSREASIQRANQVLLSPPLVDFSQL